MTASEIECFEFLKKSLMEDPIIGLPDFSGSCTFEIHTDASDSGLGAILCQINKETNEQKVIQYASRMLTDVELRYHTQEKEALAIVFAVQKFRPYVLGAHFIVRTDHKSLQWLQKSEKGRLSRWALTLSEYDFEIKYRTGKSNAHADAASRWPSEKADESWDPFPDYATPEEKLIKEIQEKEETIRINTLKVKNQTERVNNLDKMVRDAQFTDKKFRDAKALLKDNKLDKATDLLNDFFPKKFKFKLVEVQGILCRENEGKLIQILIPRSAQELHMELLFLHHDSITGGHFGRTRTYVKVSSRYYLLAFNV